MFQVENALLSSVSTLVRIELPSSATSVVGTLGVQVNAIGYASRQDLVYGIASRSLLGLFPSHGHVVTIDRRGHVTDLGPVRNTGPVWVPYGGLAGAVAGAIVGTAFYVREHDKLYTVDVNPSSGSYLGILRVVHFPFGSPALTVDDFDVNPADGLLYGVSTGLLRDGEIVSINPTNGVVRRMATPARPPGGPSYGAVVIGPDRAMYATNNHQLLLHSRLYRIPLDGGTAVTPLGARPVVVSSDAAGCLGRQQPQPPPPQPPPPVPPPTSAPPPPAPPPPTSPGPVPIITTTPGVPGVPGITTTAQPPVPSTPGSPPPAIALPGLQRPPTAQRDTTEDTALKRRWSLALLLLLLAGGVIARSAARRH